MRPYILKCIHFSNKKLLALFYIRAGHHTKLLISSSLSQHKTFKSMRTAILCCERVQIVSLQMIQKLYRILKCFKVKQLTQRQMMGGCKPKKGNTCCEPRCCIHLLWVLYVHIWMFQWIRNSKILRFSSNL